MEKQRFEQSEFNKQDISKGTESKFGVNPEKLQPMPRESEPTEIPKTEEVTVFEAFGKRGQKPPDGQETPKESKLPDGPETPKESKLPTGQEKEPQTPLENKSLTGQVEAEKTISLAREAEEAFSRNDFDAALDKLRELQRATSPEGVVEGEYHEQLLKEFERQVETITGREYAEAAGMKPDEYRKMFEPLKERIREIAQREKEMKEGHIPFVIVIKNDVIAPEKEMPLIELDGKKGYTNMSADEIKNFKPIEGVKIPNGQAYLAVNIETGKTSLGKTPDEAIKNIKSENRSPLTLEEGVALITHHPEILKDHYVWMPGSRHGDGRVARLWLDLGVPELDWLWASSSHARWGSASCLKRI